VDENEENVGVDEKGEGVVAMDGKRRWARNLELGRTQVFQSFLLFPQQARWQLVVVVTVRRKHPRAQQP
jgi:hypothetical protein